MSKGPIMILAGGTGGHVFPGLAVAKEISKSSVSVVWMGTRKGLEAKVVPEEGIEVEWISVTGLRGRGIMAWVFAPFRLALALFQAFMAMRRRRPAAVLGFGGFVSGPGGVAAWLMGSPLLIHEQNAVAGTTNRILTRFAKHTFQAFPDSFPKSVDAELIGNPVRSEIVTLYDAYDVSKNRDSVDCIKRLRLLVLGGSQGAKALNLRVPEALAELPQNVRPDVWHQAGRGLTEAREAYSKYSLKVRLDDFIDDMQAAYSWADLVICRAGALTIAELSLAGLGAILVPYPYSTDDHQLRNAQNFVSGGAGIVIPQNEFTPEKLSKELNRILLDSNSLISIFANNARAQALPKASKNLAKACFQYAGVQT